MATFKFKRTVQYTEEIEVEANTEVEATALALEEDGVRNNDDSVVDIELMSKA